MTAEMCAPLPDLADEFRAQVDQHLWGASSTYPMADEDTASEDKGAACTHRRRAMKSGKVRTMDTYVTKRVRWLHEMFFTMQGQFPVYSEMGLALSMDI